MDNQEAAQVSDMSDMDISESEEDNSFTVEPEMTAAQQAATHADMTRASVASRTAVVIETPRGGLGVPTLIDNNAAEDWSMTPSFPDDSIHNLEQPSHLDWSMTTNGNLPLVVEQPTSYVIEISDASDTDSSDDIIESLYGPFTTQHQHSGRETPVSSPRATLVQTDKLMSKEKEIERLKRLIAEREKIAKAVKEQARRVKAMPDQDTTPNDNNSNNTPQPEASTPSQAQTTAVSTTQEPNEPVTNRAADSDESDMVSEATDARIQLKVAGRSAPAKENDKDGQPTPSHTADAMDSGEMQATPFTDPEVLEMAEAVSLIDVVESQPDEHYDSDCSYHTAPGSPTPSENESESIKEIQSKISQVQQEIDDFNDQLQAVEKRRHDVSVKILGLQIRLSLEKNRKQISRETVPERSSKAPSSGKRNYGMDRTDEHHTPKRRKNDAYQGTSAHAAPPAGDFSGSNPRFNVPPDVGLVYETPSPHVKYPPTHPPSRPIPAPIRIQPQRPTPPASTLSPSSPVSGVTPIADGSKLTTFMAEVEELIKMRLSTDNRAPLVSAEKLRPVPRPSRLVTIDGFTLTLDSVLLNRRQLLSGVGPSDVGAIPNEAQMKETPFNPEFESLLYNVVENKDSLNQRAPQMKAWLEKIIDAVPPTLKLDHAPWEATGDPSLLPLRQVVMMAAMDQPDCELFWDLYAEVLLYWHGPSEQFLDDLQPILAQVPLSVDAYWQRVRAAKILGQEWISEATSLLEHLGSRKTSAEDLNISGLTAEVLLRMIRYGGLDAVWRPLTGTNNPISPDSVEPFSLENTQPFIHLSDRDVYIVWMMILCYFVSHQMPDSICVQWYRSLISKGTVTAKKPPFTINWSTVVSNTPFSRSEQLAISSILLSMLRYFCKKARWNETKRPLLLGVWHTLLDFLVHIECYKKAGTLTLLRGGLDISALQPELHDIAASLETQMGKSKEAIERLQLASQPLSMEGKLILAYRAAHLLAPTESSTPEVLHAAARLVGHPMGYVYDMSRMPSEEGNVHLDYVRRLYLGALNIDPWQPLPFKRNAQPSQFPTYTFAWINLIFLTQISRWLYRTPVLRVTLTQQLEQARDLGIETIQNEDSKLLIFKYAKECLRDE